MPSFFEGIPSYLLWLIPLCLWVLSLGLVLVVRALRLPDFLEVILAVLFLASLAGIFVGFHWSSRQAFESRYDSSVKDLTSQADPMHLWQFYLKAPDSRKQQALDKVISLLAQGRNCIIESHAALSQIEDPETVIPFKEDLVRLCCYIKARNIKVSSTAHGTPLTASYERSGKHYTGATLNGKVSVTKLPVNTTIFEESISATIQPSSYVKKLQGIYPYEAPFPDLYKLHWLPKLFAAFGHVSDRGALVAALKNGMGEDRGPKLGYYPVIHSRRDFDEVAKAYIGQSSVSP